MRSKEQEARSEKQEGGRNRKDEKREKREETRKQKKKVPKRHSAQPSESPPVAAPNPPGRGVWIAWETAGARKTLRHPAGEFPAEVGHFAVLIGVNMDPPTLIPGEFRRLDRVAAAFWATHTPRGGRE